MKYSGTTITTPFTVSDIHLCFSCAGGGGGTVGPGTPNQVSKFITATTIGDSSGGPDDGTNPVPWNNGLSVNDSGYNKRRPNGANCTTQNLLVEYDGSTIAGVASVQTASLGSQHVIGVAGQGAGCAGNVQITDHAFGSCIFDNQTVIHDAVVASTITPGYCSDGGATVQGTQVIGRVASLNTGVGTIAVVDWFTGDTFGAAGTITSCSTGGSNAYYAGIGQVISCDPLTTDDGAGHMTMKGLGLTDTSNAGYWYQKQGALPSLTATNSFYFSPGASITASWGIQPAATAPTAGNCVQWGAGDAANWLKISDSGAPCGTSSITLQTNSVNNASQTLLNLIAGTNITLTNTSGGNVQIAAAGAGAAPQASNPSAPTLTTNGSAGSTSYTYAVVGCEDGPTCAYHSAASSTTAIATGNATLTSSNSINIKTYADTLYGYRCYNIYRTASAGTPSSTGKIATCVWKSFIDTGLAGDSTTAPNTNTTALDPNGLTNPLPGCNKIPASPYGIDGVPCTPNAMDDEFSWGNGTFTAADSNNPLWAWVNQSTSTNTLTNGELNLSTSATGISLLTQTEPATPCTFVVPVNMTVTGTGNARGGIAWYDGTKVITFTQSIQSSVFELEVTRWTDVNTFSAFSLQLSAVSGVSGNWMYLRAQDTGTNLVYSYSWDGVVYKQVFSESRTAFMATGPTKVGMAIQSPGGNAITMAYDYFRRTQ